MKRPNGLDSSSNQLPSWPTNLHVFLGFVVIRADLLRGLTFVRRLVCRWISTFFFAIITARRLIRVCWCDI